MRAHNAWFPMATFLAGAWLGSDVVWATMGDRPPRIDLALLAATSCLTGLLLITSKGVASERRSGATLRPWRALRDTLVGAIAFCAVVQLWAESVPVSRSLTSWSARLTVAFATATLAALATDAWSARRSGTARRAP